MAETERYGAVPGCWYRFQWVIRRPENWTQIQIEQTEALLKKYLPVHWSMYSYWEIYKGVGGFRAAIDTHEYGRPPALSQDFEVFLQEFERELQRCFPQNGNLPQ
jgi:hypothetical protein